MHIRLASTVAMATLFSVGVVEARAQAPSSFQAAVPSNPAPSGAGLQPVSFTRLVAALQRGQIWGRIEAGLLCVPHADLIWTDGRQDIKAEDFKDVFRREMIRAGFKVERDPSNLFEQNTSPSDLEVAGQITAVNENLCYPLSGARNLRVVKGSATIDIEWQVYSHARRAMLARIRTTGEYRTGSAMEGANNPILLNAFSESVRRLAADGSFRKIFLDSPSAPNAVAAPEKPAPLDLPGAIAPGKRAIGDAVGSVVVIFAGDGHGSGALVSRDGYILTAQHVVGDAKFVKIRWSDGFETVGEVVRWAKARDIALVKSDAHGRQPLSLNLNPMQPGDTVFAIGAPLNAQFQSTVTRGIVSANRVIDGFAFIQSDVMVNHGNSGGPLLDENGAVVGFTDLGYRPQDIPTGLNLFIPTRDAIDFLNLKPKP